MRIVLVVLIIVFSQLGNAYYVPSQGRYLQPDAEGLGAGMNPYLYAEAAPQSYVDKNGRAAILLNPGFWAGLGAIGAYVGTRAFQLMHSTSGDTPGPDDPADNDSVIDLSDKFPWKWQTGESGYVSPYNNYSGNDPNQCNNESECSLRQLELELEVLRLEGLWRDEYYYHSQDVEMQLWRRDLSDRIVQHNYRCPNHRVQQPNISRRSPDWYEPNVESFPSSHK